MVKRIPARLPSSKQSNCCSTSPASASASANRLVISVWCFVGDKSLRSCGRLCFFLYHYQHHPLFGLFQSRKHMKELAGFLFSSRFHLWPVSYRVELAEGPESSGSPNELGGHDCRSSIHDEWFGNDPGNDQNTKSAFLYMPAIMLVCWICMAFPGS
jgi:hypothetical protein